MSQNNRIFFGYRKGTSGEKYAKELFRSVADEQRYGKSYYSEETDPGGNVKDYSFLNNVEYFVILYSEGFFDRKGDSVPILFKEIEWALDNENPKTKFIAVLTPGFQFPRGFDLDAEYRKVLAPKYHDDSQLERITGSKQNEFLKKSTILNILLIKREVRNSCADLPYNVHLSTKEEIEQIPFYQRLYDAQEITFVNFAGTSFISGADAATEDRSDNYDTIKSEFRKGTTEGAVQFNVVLTKPGTFASGDAGCYKIKPNLISERVRQTFHLASEGEVDPRVLFEEKSFRI